MLYRVVLVSAYSILHTVESVTHTHTHTHTHIYMYVYVYSYILFLLSLPPSSHVLPLGCGPVQAGLPVPHGSGPLLVCVTHGGACMSVLLSQPIRSLLPPLWPGARLAPVPHGSGPLVACVTHGVYVCQCCFLSPSRPLVPPLCPQVRSLRLTSIL